MAKMVAISNAVRMTAGASIASTTAPAIREASLTRSQFAAQVKVAWSITAFWMAVVQMPQ
jgi:hypothetical protein